MFSYQNYVLDQIRSDWIDWKNMSWFQIQRELKKVKYRKQICLNIYFRNSETKKKLRTCEDLSFIEITKTVVFFFKKETE